MYLGLVSLLTKHSYMIKKHLRKIINSTELKKKDG